MALFLSMLGLVCGVVGTVVGRRRSPTANLAASPRATIGIYETIDHFLTSNSVLQWSAAAARDGNKPYQKAMDWIQNDDPLQLLATDATLIQRYLAVYFYFATSLLHPWSGSCAPSLPSTNDANQEDCIYQLLYKRHPLQMVELS